MAIMSIFFIVFIFVLLEVRASEKLLGEISIIKLGRSIVEVKERLGPPMEFDKLRDVLAWGQIKDEGFCEGKKLYRFYISTPPCRALQVYTDINDVVYVTWKGL